MDNLWIIYGSGWGNSVWFVDDELPDVFWEWHFCLNQLNLRWFKFRPFSLEDPWSISGGSDTWEHAPCELEMHPISRWFNYLHGILQIVRSMRTYLDQQSFSWHHKLATMFLCMQLHHSPGGPALKTCYPMLVRAFYSLSGPLPCLAYLYKATLLNQTWQSRISSRFMINQYIYIYMYLWLYMILYMYTIYAYR